MKSSGIDCQHFACLLAFFSAFFQHSINLIRIYIYLLGFLHLDITLLVATSQDLRNECRALWRVVGKRAAVPRVFG